MKRSLSDYVCKYAHRDCGHFRLTQEPLVKSVSLAPDADVVAYFSTPTVDADDEIVLPMGGDIGRFSKNPVVLLNHSYGQPGGYYPLPVGRTVKLEKTPQGILGHIKFATDTKVGAEVASLVKDEFLRGISIGFRPLESSKLTRDEAMRRKDWKEAFDRTRGAILVHRRWTLLEVSIVPIPCDENSLILRYEQQGEMIPKWVKTRTAYAKSMKRQGWDGLLTTSAPALPDPGPLPPLNPLSPEQEALQALERVHKFLVEAKRGR